MEIGTEPVFNIGLFNIHRYQLSDFINTVFIAFNTIKITIDIIRVACI